MGFHWVTPPSKLAENIEEYGKRAYVAIHAAAAFWGQGTQDEARGNAPWEDRTGNARGGLFYAVDGFGMGEVIGSVEADARAQMRETSVEAGDADTLIITLGHTVFYGKFLELSNAGRYAIIMSTIEKRLPQLERNLHDIFQ